MRPTLAQMAGGRLAPVMLTFVSAIMWGLWWIPIRLIESMGLTGAQASLLCNLGAVILVVGVIGVRGLSPRLGAQALAGAFLIALAFTLYSIAITLSDVVRVILLFYLAPAWSKIIEWAFLRLPWQRSSWLTLALSLIGAYLVLGGDLSLGSLNIGDLMALVAGVSWAIGAALIFTGRSAPIAALTLATVGSGAVQSALFVLLLGETSGAAAGLDAVTLSLILGAVYLVPVIGMTLWGAVRLSPALLSFLFTLEIVSGVVSGALLLDEPFGIFQGVGGFLIFAAAIYEAIMTLRATPSAQSRA